MAKAKRGPAHSASQPINGPPIGVLPRNTIAYTAMTRPRIDGAEATCIIVFPVAMKTMLAKPSDGEHAERDAGVWAHTRRPPSRPQRDRRPRPGPRELARRRLAITRAPSSDPAPIADSNCAYSAAPPPKANRASSGSSTEKLNDIV